MSTFHNNNFLHNLRTAVRMVDANMPPSVVSAAFKERGIDIPAGLVATVSQPGVLESISAKPMTHAVADNHIEVYNSVFLPFTARLQGVCDDSALVAVKYQDGGDVLVAVEYQDHGEAE